MPEPSDPATPGHVYATDYFDSLLPGSLRSARTILPLVVKAVDPQSALDVGCGTGAWLSVLSELGVDDLVGVDGGYVDRDALRIDPVRFQARDLAQPLDLGRRFDLVSSLEVAEHLDPAAADTFVASLVAHGDVILFSAAIPRQGGEHHVNEQWPEYWAARFAEHGYVAVDAIRPRVWDDPAVELWYAQNVLLFVRAPALVELPALAPYVQEPGAALAKVHPRLFDYYRPWSGEGQREEPLAGLAPRPRLDPTDLDLVVFSKDRPAQLELLLRSAKTHWEEWDEVGWSIVFKASAPEFAAGYARVRALHPEFAFLDEDAHPETTFADLVRGRIGTRATAAFLVDDNVFRLPFSLAGPEWNAFDADPSIGCVSVRMSPHVGHSYPTDELTPPPPLDARRTWAWRGLPGGWGYPMSIDFHVFRTPELAPLLGRVAFHNPNSLEAALAERPLGAPRMICFADSPIVNLAVNRVQDTYANRHAGLSDPAELNVGFLEGRRLDLAPIEAIDHGSTHHELALTWEATDPVYVAWADEVTVDPELFAAFADAVAEAATASLVIIAADYAEEEIAPAVSAALDAAGLGDDDGPDISLLCVSAGEGEAIVRALDPVAILSARPPRAGVAGLVHRVPPGTAPAAPAAPDYVIELSVARRTPELLRGFAELAGESVPHDGPAPSLVVYAPDTLASDVEAEVAELVAAAGLDADDAPEVTLLCVPGAEGDAALAGLPRLGGPEPMDPPDPDAKRAHLLSLFRGRGHRTLIESGTYLGDMVAHVRPYAERIVSIEVDPALHAKAAERFAGDLGVEILQGDAANLVPELVGEATHPPLIWLDGHFSGGVTGQGAEVEPAVTIVRALGVTGVPWGTTIMVDDLRMFGRELAPWPTLEALMAAARQAFPEARIYPGLDCLVIEVPQATGWFAYVDGEAEGSLSRSLGSAARAAAPDAPPQRFEDYVADGLRYAELEGAEPIDAADLMPMLDDLGVGNPYDGHYFFQDVWAANRVAQRRPERHVDVGSRVDYVGFLTAICPVTFVDIRPLSAQLEGLESVVGSALEMPFEDRSVASLSCLHVAEHIGLGRYGDPLDPLGTVKAAAELQRVLAPGGELLFSLPVGVPRVCFNAHRVLGIDAVLSWFDELELVEHAGVDDLLRFARHRGLDELAQARYACGMFHLRRPLD